MNLSAAGKGRVDDDSKHWGLWFVPKRLRRYVERRIGSSEISEQRSSKLVGSDSPVEPVSMSAPTPLKSVSTLRVMTITGAGISVGSGLPTYRGVDGVYTDIVRETNMRIEDIVSIDTLRNRPDLLWRHWHGLLMSLQGAKPSIAHNALKRIGDACADYLEVTQNVDGLSLAAGLEPSRLVEIHGSTNTFSCSRCGAKHQLSISADMPLPPRCYDCNNPGQAPIRPDVVLFGEDISLQDLEKAWIHASCTNLLIISGTTLQFQYLVGVIGAAAQNNATILYIDPQASTDNPLLFGIHSSIHCIKSTADETLPKIASYLESGAPISGLIKAITIESDRE